VSALNELSEILPAGVLITDPTRLESYRQDWAREPSAAVPLAVVRAHHDEHVRTAVRWAAKHRVPVVPRGAGSGLSGGASAVAGGIVVSLEAMDCIEIDADSRVAVVEPGALNAAVKRAAAAHGLWYPPDPSSYEMCTIGGNIATNAGGLCCVKYGVTTDYVLGLDVVLADGTSVTLGGKRIKDVAGLSLLKLFVGSEGTLGIVTRAILRLVPLPGPRATLVATFDTMADASRAVVESCRRVRLSMLELIDGISALAHEHDTTIAVVAHAGDGNTHPIIVFDPDDTAATARAHAAFADVMKLAISLGGTITGEHGVGRTKKAALPDQLGPDVMALNRAVKHALDPAGILNPGAILD